MTRRSKRVFLDTSAIFAAVLSESGGARKLLQLGEAGVIQLLIGPNVLRECEEVVKRKCPDSLPRLAYLLELAGIEITSKPGDEEVKAAKSIVSYKPDAYVLAEAMSAKPDWFITHDKQHFLKKKKSIELTFQLGTPGDFIISLEDDLRLKG
jgi:predicted nucleic acid-binding protein